MKRVGWGGRWSGMRGGGLGVGVGWPPPGGGEGVSWVRGASTGGQATTSTVSPPMRQTNQRCVSLTLHLRSEMTGKTRARESK